MKHILKTLILILIPFISFSQSLGKSGGKTRIAPTTQIRKGTKPRQVLMTRVSDSSLVYADLDTIIKVNEAYNGLRLSNGVVVMGSNDPTNAKGSEFTSTIYNHMAGNNDVWLNNNGINNPFMFHANGNVSFNTIDGTNSNGKTIFRLSYNDGRFYLGTPSIPSQVTGQGGYSTVGGGYSNFSNSYLGYLGGGTSNTINGFAIFLGGGEGNTANNNYSAIVGGYLNTANGNNSFVGSGQSNSASGNWSIVPGGLRNIASAVCSSVSGGRDNSVSGENGNISGGTLNQLTGGESFIGAGKQNTQSGTLSFLGAGYLNIQSGENGFLGAGYQNNQSGVNGAIITGSLNMETSDYGVVVGGYENTVNSYGMFALGNANVPFTGQTISSSVPSDLLLTVGNGLINNTKSNAVTILKDGSFQINNDGYGSTLNQSKTTPHAALDVVSTTKGFQAPRMTETQLNTYLATFNLTTDLTGGTDGIAYSKIGMEVICVDCTALDGSTTGVKVNLYPNAAQTAWIAKKAH